MPLISSDIPEKNPLEVGLKLISIVKLTPTLFVPPLIVNLMSYNIYFIMIHYDNYNTDDNNHCYSNSCHFDHNCDNSYPKMGDIPEY